MFCYTSWHEEPYFSWLSGMISIHLSFWVKRWRVFTTCKNLFTLRSPTLGLCGVFGKATLRRAVLLWQPQDTSPLAPNSQTESGGVRNIDTLSRDGDFASLLPPFLKPGFLPALPGIVGCVNSVKLHSSHFTSCTWQKKGLPCGFSFCDGPL